MTLESGVRIPALHCGVDKRKRDNYVEYIKDIQPGRNTVNSDMCRASSSKTV